METNGDVIQINSFRVSKCLVLTTRKIWSSHGFDVNLGIWKHNIIIWVSIETGHRQTASPNIVHTSSLSDQSP